MINDLKNRPDEFSHAKIEVLRNGTKRHVLDMLEDNITAGIRGTGKVARTLQSIALTIIEQIGKTLVHGTKKSAKSLYGIAQG